MKKTVMLIDGSSIIYEKVKKTFHTVRITKLCL